MDTEKSPEGYSCRIFFAYNRFITIFTYTENVWDCFTEPKEHDKYYEPDFCVDGWYTGQRRMCTTRTVIFYLRERGRSLRPDRYTERDLSSYVLTETRSESGIFQTVEGERERTLGRWHQLFGFDRTPFWCIFLLTFLNENPLTPG